MSKASQRAAQRERDRTKMYMMGRVDGEKGRPFRWRYHPFKKTYAAGYYAGRKGIKQ